jgi:hypothetical protein
MSEIATEQARAPKFVSDQIESYAMHGAGAMV